jgi:Cu/Ag efflux protein CusF
VWNRLQQAFSRRVTNVSRYRVAFVVILTFPTVLFGGGRPDKLKANPRYCEVRGIVRGFSPDRATIEIEHENIPGSMPAMTMPFRPRNPKDIAPLTQRDALAFRLEVTDKDALMDNIPENRR